LRGKFRFFVRDAYDVFPLDGMPIGLIKVEAGIQIKILELSEFKEMR